MSLLSQYFLFRDGSPTALLLGNYQPWMVLLSLAVASLTSALALQLAGMARAQQVSGMRQLMLFSGSLAMGGGVWSMHFIGMLAFNLCTHVDFHAGITLASMLPAVLASWVALNLISRGTLGRALWVLGGVVVGAGIGAMHYTGMAAMEMSPLLRYDPLWFGASIVVAVLLAMLALWVRFGLEHRVSPLAAVLLGGLVMGCAIAGMHYTAMGAARFVGMPDDPCVNTVDRNGYLALAITVVTLGISLLTAGANGLLRYRSLNRELGLEKERIQKLMVALSDSEEQYRSLIANSPGVTFRCRIDDSWSSVLVSDAMETLSGWPAADFLAGKVNHGQLIHPDDLPNAEAVTRAAIAANESYSVEYRLRHRDGSERWVSASGRASRDADGTPRFIDGVMVDISEAKRMVQQLRDAKDSAEAAVAAKGAFLANMSHEIRTPMNAVLGFTELLLDTTLTELQRKHLTTVRGSARSLLGLLNDILDTAKLEKGAIELEQLDFSLHAVCEQTFNSLRLGAQRKGLALQMDYPDSEPHFFKGDPLRIQQVLVNIVGNAIKFTEKGAVTLSMRMAQGCVHLAVTDTGIGIAADRIERIFDAFAQADASTTRRFGGTGLGTTISRQLVERMGGRITVESALGLGSTFNIWLPLPAGEAVAEAIEGIGMVLPPLRLLVADDVAQNGELMQLMLGRDGHQVRVVTNGLEALQAFSEQDFDAVLMDVHMPELDGLGATRRIRQFELSHSRSRTPVIALTASVLEEDRQAALAAGMDGFATKPIESALLRAEIARVLGLAAMPLPAAASATTSPAAGEDESAALDFAHGIRLWGNASAWRRALRRFGEEQREGGPRLMALLRSGEWLEARALVHRWRGVSGSLAMPRLLAATKPVEELLRQGHHEEAMRAGEAVAAALAATLDEITELSRAANTAPAPLLETASAAGDRVPPELLARVERALKRGELDDAALAELAQRVGSARCAPLIEALDQFDFEAALKALKSLNSLAAA
ncbi:MHYT domain-containing protein [Paucibacter sp. R3-3]|uniref:histidine kinase n=1 Tax=Roseateles agri TaxID=3098619 RepID=A0ABU5DQN3_9BURK|nr:MHYT domain-containing protein [Paucibacter sp. R3-3]MDY0748630.1 MHYT domain-containing protein [Paucibacter sp. R3-3]